jgi:hypothetical protein
MALSTEKTLMAALPYCPNDDRYHQVYNGFLSWFLERHAVATAAFAHRVGRIPA